MIIKKYINENNIIQYYTFDKTCEDNKYFNHLEEYKDLTKSTIFVCSTLIDTNFINFHKGEKWVYFTSKITDEVIDNLDTDYIKDYFIDNIELQKKIKSINCKIIKSKISNFNKIKKVNVENSIVFLILASKKEEYIDKYNNLLEYLKTFNYDYFILLSGQENKIDNNIIYVNFEDNWENIPKKVITAFEILYNKCYYSHIYKVDDNFMNVNINLSDEIFKKDYYGNYLIRNFKRDYHFGKCKDNELNNLEYENDFIHTYAAGGYGYVISRAALYILINNKQYIMNEIYEDKAIGDVLFSNNIFINENKYEKLKYQKPISQVKDIVKKDVKKCAVIFFHKNLFKIYEEKWINKCIESILNQTYKNYDILEVNYGNDNYSIFKNMKISNNKYFYKKNYKTHTEAMVFLLNEGFTKYNYDVIFNTNLDDYYNESRFEKQLRCVLEGYHLCSSLMNYIKENENKEDMLISEWTSESYSITSNEYYIEKEKISEQLNENHNVINHSCVCFTKEFWKGYDKYNNLLRYRDDKPYEDLTLWTRAINNNYNITIINEPLIEYRIHDNQIGEQNKKKEKNINVDTGFTSEPCKKEKRIGIFCICTGNYINYLSDLISSILEKFLINYEKIFIISTDQIDKVKKICDKFKIKNLIKNISKKGFPLDTLYRYKYLLEYDVELELVCDVLYYIDVDMKILELVGNEILPEGDRVLIGTKHPGFAFSNNKNGSPENNKLSKAYIDENKFKNCYIAGGFNGGITHHFINMAKELDMFINIDKSNDIIAKWHDESHLNRYLLDNFEKFKILSSDYCYPENYHEKIPGTPKILALYKDHNIIRNKFKKYKLVVNVKGGLGNILFQIFFGYTIALRYNLELCLFHNQNEILNNICPNDKKRESIFHYHLFDNILRTDENFFKEEYLEIKEDKKYYTDILSTLPMNKNIYLNGFFQSTKFFNHNIERIKQKLNYNILDIAKDIINKYKMSINKKLIAIHIRGTDYIKLKEYHTNIEIDYYQKCLNSINNLDDYEIILFTDDYDFSENNFSNLYSNTISNIKNEFISDDFKYLKNNGELDLFLMSLFDIIICANSTFSLWATYFSNSEKIFIPFNWFGESGPKDFIVEDLCLNDNYEIVH